MKPGSVPTDRIGPIVDELIQERWPHGSGIEVLAEKVGCDWKTIANVIEREHEGVDFDLADALLCALGRPDIWRGRLADLYLEMPLLEQCQAPGCNIKFAIGVDRLGRPKQQRYCSPQCNHAAYKIRSGRNQRRLVAAHRDQSKRCRNGHVRTPENTKTLYDGRRTCRVCFNASRRVERTAA